VRHSERVERLWLTRMRWRMRGAWLWPAFFALTALDGILLAALPPYDGAPPGVVGGVLLSGFANLLLIAVGAPLAGRWLRRRRRPDLPRMVAADYAGTALVAALTVVLLGAGLAHRPAAAAQHDDVAAVGAALRAYVAAQAPEWRGGLDAATAAQLAPETYRACVPGPDPARWLCLIVDTDQRPPGVVRDGSMRPN
jgi:hypothetical protein